MGKAEELAAAVDVLDARKGCSELTSRDQSAKS
jgi:hypothetical protein